MNGFDWVGEEWEYIDKTKRGTENKTERQHVTSKALTRVKRCQLLSRSRYHFRLINSFSLSSFLIYFIFTYSNTLTK